jgi:hypothetical protein
MHFVAYCEKYPSLCINVPALRKSFDKRGREHDSTVMKFVNRVFDSRVAGLTEEEAALVLAQFRRMQERPYGAELVIHLATEQDTPKKKGAEAHA